MTSRLCAFSFLTASLAVASTTAQAFSFSLTPVTFTGPNNPSPIVVNGTVIVAPGETFYNPTMMSTTHLPFKSGFTAGFNGPGQNWHASFVAWNGIGTYSGPIFQFAVNPGNLGYAGGMPVGLYNKNLLGPGGNAALVLNYASASGITVASASTYAIQVVPEPATLGAILAGLGLFARRNRRRTSL